MSENIVGTLASTLVDSTKLLSKITGRFINWVIDPWVSEKEQHYDFESYFDSVKLFKIIDENNIKPKQVASYESSLGRVYKFTIPPGMTLKDFLKEKDGLSTQLGQDINMRLSGSYLEIEIIEKNLPKLLNYKVPTRSATDGIEITIGESLEHKVTINLKENPNTYIVGSTGSGKSVCTKVILTSLINCYSSDELELILCDLKRVELNLFSNIKHCSRFVYTVEDTTEVINDVLKEVEDRYDLFMKYKVTDIFSYNKLQGVKKLKFKILYIEEIVMLLESKNKRATKLLKQLAAICRAAGVYCILTTQRPSSDILDSVIKANINNRIVFKCEDTKNSVVALDRKGAENLEGKGHGYLKQGYSITEFRGYYITDTQVNKYIKKYIVRDKIIKDYVKKDNIKKEDRKIIDVENNKLTDMSFLDNI